MDRIPNKARIFIVSIYILTIALIFFGFDNGYIEPELTNLMNIAFFSILVLLNETLTVHFNGISYSTSFGTSVAIYILFGPLSAIVIRVIGYSLRIIEVKDRKYKHILNTPFYGTLFNYCLLTIPMIISNFVYLELGGDFYISNIKSNLISIILFSLIYFVVNSILISTFSAIMSEKNFFYVLLGNFKIAILNIFAMLPFGIIIAVVFNQYDYIGVILMFFPTLLARYTFSLHLKSKQQYLQLVEALSKSLEARDKYTEGHSQRVADIVTMIAKEFKFNQWRIEELRIASLLHDVGKIGIPDNVLNKPGKLTNEEFALIEEHPQIGYNILNDIDDMDRVNTIVRHHHERYDGEGYPLKKNVNDLEIDVFIVQLADAIDAMSTDRPYRKALTQDIIIEEIIKHSGTQFHPKVVDAYLRAVGIQK